MFSSISRRIFLTALLFLMGMLAVQLAGCSKPEQSNPRLEGQIYGTFWQVTLPGSFSEERIAELHTGIVEVLQQIDASMSTYRDDSELMRFNRLPAGEWMVLSKPLLDVLLLSQSVSESSDGAFDVTVGRLVNLWSFGPEQRPLAIPDEQELQQRLAQVGYQNLELDIEGGRARKHSDCFVDLSGVAKGFAVDEVARWLKGQGLEHFLVNIGGDLLAGGEREAGQPWRIGVEVPHEGLPAAHHVLPIRNMSVATSGDYRNFFEEDGQRFSHTIDPTTGWPIKHNLASVTVLTPDNASADAWATAFMVMGVERSLEVAQAEGIKLLLITRENGGWRSYISESMEEYVGSEMASELLERR
ncbi:FAD:protein FMN transferase [Nitrincola alkalilacustris]|uniref:FAD:protein FMN transferase n=1 Tax=Nitrincola alkalilacustris TaxID=1571224 RepID=UPI001F10B8CE|nr:FAD:protein FMN transferase [Nitrincola alkalilacustris]